MIVECEWGEHGLANHSERSDVIVIVDVLSFSTAVEIATARGAAIHPVSERGREAADLAAKVHAELAGPRGDRFSLSPRCYVDVRPGTRVVVPSVNGGRLSRLTCGGHVITGCLRNASAVARAASAIGSAVTVIPAGERWPDGSLRPALEDWLGAGAIISALGGAHSAEAEAAATLFRGSADRLHETLRASVSGRELIGLGYDDDVSLASEHDVSDCVPHFSHSAYVRVG